MEGDHPPILTSDAAVLNSRTSWFPGLAPKPWSLLAHHHRAVHHYHTGKNEHKLSGFTSGPKSVAAVTVGGKREPVMEEAIPASNSSTSSGSHPVGEVILPSSLPDIVCINKEEKEKEEENTVHSPLASTAPLLWGALLESSSAVVLSGCSNTPDMVSMRVISSAAVSVSHENTEVEGTQDTVSSMRVEASDVCMGIRVVLENVRALHLSRCPLCAPVSSPKWWTTFRGEGQYRERHRPSPGRYCGKKKKRSWNDEECVSEESHCVMASSTTWVGSGGASQETKKEDSDNNNNGHACLSGDEHHEEERDEGTDTLQLLRSETGEFLEHVYSRRRYLAESRPSMYDACPETHVLWRKCASLGGIVLLEALLLGL